MSLATSSLFIAVLLMAANFAEGDNGSCPMVDRLRGEMVNIKQAKENAEKNNGIVSVPKAVTVNSSEDCEQSCCGNDNCTVYLFYPRPPANPLNNEHKNYNCFFLNCRPESLCSLVNVSSKAEGAVVGIRELQDSTVQSEMSIALASVSPKASEPVTSEKESSTSEPNVTPTTSSNIMLKAEKEASTASVPLKIKKTKESTNHTTSGSLVIALAFGILFFLAVLVLIGRPWWYSFHRPRYSKVDYLMNGL